MVEGVRAGNSAPDPFAAGLQAADLSRPLRFAGRHWELALSPETGAIIGMQPAAAASSQAGRRAGPGDATADPDADIASLASPAFPLAEVMYSTYSSERLPGSCAVWPGEAGSGRRGQGQGAGSGGGCPL